MTQLAPTPLVASTAPTAKVGLSGCIHHSQTKNQIRKIWGKTPTNVRPLPHVHVSLVPDEKQLTEVSEEMNGWNCERL